MPRSARPCQSCFERQPQHKGLLCGRCWREQHGLPTKARERRPVERARPVVRRVELGPRPAREVMIAGELYEVVWDGS